LSQLQRVQEHGDGFFVRTTFFEEQLTAFEIWLDHTACLPTPQRSAPEQLPIVLQVMMTTIHNYLCYKNLLISYYMVLYRFY